jgi:hypothetical protein
VQDVQPTLEDARRTAEEELKLLPANASQVDCAPSMATVPPFTRLSGLPGTQRMVVLADGRCFVSPDRKALPEVEAIEP